MFGDVPMLVCFHDQCVSDVHIQRYEDGDRSRFIRVRSLSSNKDKKIEAVMPRLHFSCCGYQLDNRDDMKTLSVLKHLWLRVHDWNILFSRADHPPSASSPLLPTWTSCSCGDHGLRGKWQ